MECVQRYETSIGLHSSNQQGKDSIINEIRLFMAAGRGRGFVESDALVVVDVSVTVRVPW
jgi:hypothetical protein